MRIFVAASAETDAVSIRDYFGRRNPAATDLDPAHLYREESHASLMTPGGALPLQFHIDADSMEDALKKFPNAARQTLEHTLEELRRLRREAQSSVVVPGAGGPGAMPGGGRIKF